LKHMRMARDKPRPQDRSAIYSEFSDEFSLLHPTRLSKICAARIDIDNAGTDCGPRNLISTATHKWRTPSKKSEIQKEPNRKALLPFLAEVSLFIPLFAQQLQTLPANRKTSNWAALLEYQSFKTLRNFFVNKMKTIT